jgi:ABC-type antimicrobial peptide transport system permease subunit
LYFPGADAVGNQITLSDSSAAPRKAPPIAATIAGIVPDFGQHAADLVLPIVYVPYEVDPQPGMFLVVRAAGDPLSVAPIVREEMRAFDPDLPLMEIQAMDRLLARFGWPVRVFGTMFAIFAGIALVISAVGLYAVTAYSVAERTTEIGVRMALGAQAGDVLWLVLRRAAVQLALALPVGIAGALAVGQLIQGVLLRTNGRDPLVIGSIAAIMAAVSMAACIVPARRATQLDPLRALREE